jgi:hypothetical protein
VRQRFSPGSDRHGFCIAGRPTRSSPRSRPSRTALIVSIIVVASTGQALRLMTGRPPADRHSASSRPPGLLFVYCRPVDSEGFGGAAGMPPKLAQLPIASTYCARSHSAATMSRLGRSSKTSKRPVPFGP